jgi:hypothetical protein
MRTYLNAKAMATVLRSTLSRASIPLTHAQALEAVAVQFGFTDWNTLAAKIKAEEDATCRFNQTSPVFRMFDEASSKAFYLDFLGFKIDWEHRVEETSPLYRQVSRGSLVLHLSGHHGDSSPGALAYVGKKSCHARSAQKET